MTSEATTQTPGGAAAPAAPAAPRTSGKTRLVRQLLRPYPGALALILAAMLVETAMSLAAPWPLKIILDNVVGSHKAPDWLHGPRFIDLGGDKVELAAVAGLLVIAIAQTAVAIADLAKRGEAEAGAARLALRVKTRKGAKKKTAARPGRRA